MNATNNTTAPKVDPTVAYTRTVFVPSNGVSAEDAAMDAACDALYAARQYHRQPVMIEVTVRVAQ
jgi:hypothetical protein